MLCDETVAPPLEFAIQRSTRLFLTDNLAMIEQ